MSSRIAGAVRVCLLVLLATGTLGAEELPLKDPMQPYRPSPGASRTAAAPRTFDLTGVLVSANRRVAVLNGGLHRVGDEIEGARLVAIDAKSVRLERGGKEIVVHLNGRRASAETNEGVSRK